MTLGETKRAKNSTHEHKQICEAIKNHDALLAEKSAREHINNSKKNMEHLVGRTLLSKGDLRMSKITMTTPL